MAEAKYIAAPEAAITTSSIVPAMTEKFGYKNRLEVPRLEKIVAQHGRRRGDARTRRRSRRPPPKWS